MRLSEIPSALVRHVVRDSAFASLGFVTHRRSGLLVFIDNDAFLPALRENALVTCVLTTEAFADRVPSTMGLGLVDDARAAFYDVHEHLVHNTAFYGIAQPTRVAPTARIHESAVIAPTNVVLREHVEIGPRVVVLSGVDVGEGSVIRAGTVVGSEGFQVLMTNGQSRRVTHAGRVVIGQRVDIHSNCCVDRSVFADTVIGADTTIDNLVHVAHDVTIGRHCRIVAHAMIAGSARIGDGAWIGPCASISSGVNVGAGAYVTMGSVVTRDVEPSAHVTGNFAIDHERYLEFLRTIR